MSASDWEETLRILGADQNYANVMLRGFYGERRLTGVHRSLTPPTSLTEVAYPLGQGDLCGQGNTIVNSLVRYRHRIPPEPLGVQL